MTKSWTRTRSGSPLRRHVRPRILEVADQFLLLGVDRDRRLLLPLRRAHASRDIAKLRIPVGMLPAFARLDVALQAVAHVQQLGDHRVTDVMAQRLQRDGQRARAQAGPAQRRVRIAGRRRLDQARPGPAAASDRGRWRAFRPPPAGGASRRHDVSASSSRRPAEWSSRDPRRARDLRHAAVADRPRFGGRPQPTRSLREHRRQRRMLRPERGQPHASPYHALRTYKSILISYFLTDP